MNAILSMLLNAAVSYASSPAGQEKLLSLLPSIMGGFQSILGKIGEAQDNGATAEEQKKIALAEILSRLTAAAAKADADHAADPTDTAFDQGVFRD